MSYEEEFVNNLMLQLQKYVDKKDLNQVRDLIISESHKYDFDIKSTELVLEDETNYYMIEQFLATKSLEGRSAKTIERYKFFILKLLDFYPNKSFKDYTANDLRYFLAVYKKKGNNSDTTMDGIRRIYCSFFNWLDIEEYIYKSPAKKLNRIKHDTIKEQPYTDGEMENMMINATNIRDKAILEFLYSTACRVSELCQVDINDINYNNKTVLLHGKGGKDRIVPLTDKALFYIEKYMEYRIHNNIQSEALFVSRKPYNRITSENVRRIISNVAQKANVHNAHPHRYRVTRITVLLKRGMKLEEVQVIAGHSNINTTVSYNRCDSLIVESEFRRCG